MNEKVFKRIVDYKKNSSFLKNTIVSFVSGILGAAIVIGTCFGVPNVKNCLLGKNILSETSASINDKEINANQISLTNYSDTAVGVARKSFTVYSRNRNNK